MHSSNALDELGVVYSVPASKETGCAVTRVEFTRIKEAERGKLVELVEKFLSGEFCDMKIYRLKAKHSLVNYCLDVMCDDSICEPVKHMCAEEYGEVDDLADADIDDVEDQLAELEDEL